MHPPDADRSLVFGIYRSADDRFDATDVDVAAGGVTIVAPGRGEPTLDLRGEPAAVPGRHRLTIPVPGGLTPDPGRPYVLAVANPGAALASGDPGALASFRKRVIGVVTHGGIQHQGWKNGPAWALIMAHSLRRHGYDVAVPFNWVSRSREPGEAARQGVRLARLIRTTATRFPASEPVDLHVIGHSEGAVVNSRAINRLDAQAPPGLRAGYVKVTMLDPHAANNGLPGQQYSVADGPLGWIAKGVIDSYQSRAKDPRVVVSPGVDDAEVFFQQSPASRARAVNGGIYNLWGQVPVHGRAHYFNLTAAGATHSGKTGVVGWYQRNVVPLLGDGGSELQAWVLTGATAPGDAPQRPGFTGTGLPGSTVFLLGGPARAPSELGPIGRTVVAADGQWRATTRRLPDGRYRVVALAVPPRHHPGPRLAMIPTAPLGPLLVDGLPHESRPQG